MQNILEAYLAAYEPLSNEIDANIEKHRKGDFRVEVRRADGTPVSAKVTARQTGHAFDFGISPLMLGAMGEREQAYRDAVTDLFNFVTTTFCWNVTEIAPDKFRFDDGIEEIYRRPPAERVWHFAEENGLRAKGQPLFCGRWCPEWIGEDLDELKTAWERFVREVAARYDGKYHVFDVVNESYARGSWRNMEWLPIPRFELVKWLMTTAGEIFSRRTRMERNEPTPVNYGEYALQYYEDNKRLLEEGVRLDSIGIQFHFFNGKDCLDKLIFGESNLGEIYKNYHRLSTLGVPTYISEITVPTRYMGLSLEEGEELQATILDRLYRLWFSIPSMQGIVYWNLKDGDTWQGEDKCLGCLLDENMRRKKSYHTLENLIKREWNTTLEGGTGEDGTLAFRGFLGDYAVTVQTDDGTPPHRATVHLDRGTATAVVTI